MWSLTLRLRLRLTLRLTLTLTLTLSLSLSLRLRLTLTRILALSLTLTLRWSRVVTLRYEHGASRDGAMHELRRPEHLVGSAWPCFYDPDWDPHAAVIPSAQLAFESEMGYSLWRWALLALCVLLLLAGAAMLVYTAFLGVERVEAAMVQMH